MSKNGFDETEIIRVLAGQLITVIAMADALMICLEKSSTKGLITSYVSRGNNRANSCCGTMGVTAKELAKSDVELAGSSPQHHKARCLLAEWELGIGMNVVGDYLRFSRSSLLVLPDVRITALDRLWSDHNPILLHIDYKYLEVHEILLDSNLNVMKSFSSSRKRSKWSNNIKTLERKQKKAMLLRKFNFNEKGLMGQGDPLSPFLFILVMEGLHNAFEEAVGNGLITGVNIKNSTINVVDSYSIFGKDIWSVGETTLFTMVQSALSFVRLKDCLIIDRINNGQWSWNWSRTNLGVRNLAYLCDMLNEIGQLNIDVNEDTCTWSLGRNGTFTVKDARYRIDQNILPTLAHTTTWDKSIPRKVNVFMWRLSLDRLPHRLNLSSRGFMGSSGQDVVHLDIPEVSNIDELSHATKTLFARLVEISKFFKVPIGGGCRKKKTRSASSSRYLSSLFTGLSPPAMDFQLNASFQEFGITNKLASSIESLSSINQDLHWKLQQQQRLSSLFSGVGGETEQQHQMVLDSMQAQKLLPIMFPDLETSKSSQTEWFFDGNYAQVNVDQSHGKNVGNYENGNMNNWNNEIQGWNDFNDQYSALP
ncbi:hypothetical protein Tco_0032813 [Tanacetum coccineum]